MRWGAEAAARRLDRNVSLRGAGAAGPRGSHDDHVGRRLDLSTAIKTSQTISGEIMIDKLVETLMVAAIQHAGAERGLLILGRTRSARIEAEAVTQAEAITVRFRDTTAQASDLPD